MSDKLRALLEEHHTFPGEYTFRVIGHHQTAKGLQQTLESLLLARGVEVFRIQQRPSSAGSYISYHIHAVVSDVDQVLHLTQQFQQTHGVKIVM